MLKKCTMTMLFATVFACDVDGANLVAGEDSGLSDEALAASDDDSLVEGPREGERAEKCRCVTTCSSNGTGWTTTYKVGKAKSEAACSVKAANFCRGKAPDYKFHNSACIW